MTEAARQGVGCVFVKEWACPVEANEVPLEVCSICVEARKTHQAVASIARVSGRPPDRVSEEDALKQVRGLDKRFEEGRIDLEDYAEKRKRAIESASG